MSMLLIEPIGEKPVRLVGKGLNTALVLKPGQPQEIDSVLGAKLLMQCSQNIRVSRSQWIQSWQELAAMTKDIAESQPIFHPLQAALNTCDMAFDKEDWPGFQQAIETVRQLTKDIPSSSKTSPQGLE